MYNAYGQVDSIHGGATSTLNALDSNGQDMYTSANQLWQNAGGKFQETGYGAYQTFLNDYREYHAHSQQLHNVIHTASGTGGTLYGADKAAEASFQGIF